MINEDKPIHKIYVNSYSQKMDNGQAQSDSEFWIDLQQQYNVSTLNLDQFVGQNLLTNAYTSSKGQDFSNFDFYYYPGGIETLISVSIEKQYYTYDQVILALNDALYQAGYELVFVNYWQSFGGFINTSNYKYISKLKLEDNNVLQSSFTPIGSGWSKMLGYELKRQFADTLSVFEGQIAPDLSQPSSIVVQFPQLQSAITQSSLGTAHFVIPVNASFGESIQYTNMQKNTSLSIRFASPQNVRYLQIRLLNCDGSLLESIQSNKDSVNQQNVEYTFLMSIQ